MLVVSVVFCALFFVNVESCNEATCGSIVTKCLLTESCKCDLKQNTCTRECFNCLGSLFTDCCSCLDLCPKSLDDGVIDLGKKSVVGDFREPVPQLFQALTEYPDHIGQWVAHVIPIQLNLHMSEKDPTKPDVVSTNCTIVFWSQCMSLKKCKDGCLSMGSSGYRWFHDGCCECLGENCINYGLNESKCKSCPENDSNALELEAEYDYGEEDMDYEAEE